MNNKFKVTFSINYDSETQARIIYKSLLPEVQKHLFERSKVSISIKEQEIEINITAQDTNAAKATISSVLRWISATTEAITTFSKTNF